MGNKVVDSVTPLHLPRNAVRDHQGHTKRSGLVSFERQARSIAGWNHEHPCPFVKRFQVFLWSKHVYRGTVQSAQDLVGSVARDDEACSGRLLHGWPNCATEISNRVGIRIVRAVHPSDKQKRTALRKRSRRRSRREPESDHMHRTDTGLKHRYSVTLRNHNYGIRRPGQCEFVTRQNRLRFSDPEFRFLPGSIGENGLRVIDQSERSRRSLGQALRQQHVEVMWPADPYDVAPPAIVVNKRRTITKAVKQLNLPGYVVVFTA